MEPSTRRVVTRSPSHSVRVLHLKHLQEEPIHCDSNPERFFAQIAALYPFIKRIKHQPFRLILGERKYTPDFLLAFQDGSELVVEVKPASKVTEYVDVFASATEKLRALNIGFLVAQDVDIQANKLHLRALKIRRYAKSEFDPVASDRLLSLLSEMPDGMTIAEAVNAADVLPEQILYLIAYKWICPLRTLDISPQAVILTRENYCREVKRLNYGNQANHFEVWFGVESWDSITHSDDDTW